MLVSVFNGKSVYTLLFFNGQNNNNYFESSICSFDNFSFKFDLFRIFFFIVYLCLDKKFTIVFLIPISSFGLCFFIYSSNCFAISVFGSNFKMFFNCELVWFWAIEVLFYEIWTPSSFLFPNNFEFPLLRVPWGVLISEEICLKCLFFSFDVYLNPPLPFLVELNLDSLKAGVSECKDEDCDFFSSCFRESFLKVTSCFFFQEK